MSQRPIAAQPSGPAPRTLLGPRPSSFAETLAAPDAPSTDATLVAADAPASGRAASLPPSARSTALPEVRSEGDALVLVPRDKARYEREALLGRGGMGEVKLARDHDIDRKVAIKRLLDPDDAHSVARFIDEVRTVGNLEHPNIVPIHDVGVDEDGALFFVMKYVEGETLAKIIERLAAGDPAYHARYPFEHRLDLFTGLLRALHYAHSRGLVHRDVKPENLMVGRYGEVILMDWGIAHRIRSERKPAVVAHEAVAERAASETADGAIVGTPQYMSPEQAAGEVRELDGRSDLYSAFVVLWELLTLTPYIPGGKSALHTVLAVQERPRVRPEDSIFVHPHQPPVPVELRHYLQHGLARDKSERFADGQQALVELQRVRAGDFAVQCPVTFMKHNNTRMERFMDRHPVRAVWLAGSLALLSAFGLAGWVALATSMLG